LRRQAELETAVTRPATAIVISAKLSMLVSLAHQKESSEKCRQASGDRHQYFVGSDQGIDEASNQKAQDQVLESVE
jgi:hypothetical protein